MIVISWFQSRYTPYKASASEEFNSASRSIKPGLIAAGVVSAWVSLSPSFLSDKAHKSRIKDMGGYVTPKSVRNTLHLIR